MLWYLLVCLSSLVIGYLLGARRARKAKRRAVQQLNVQSLELLDVKASLNALRRSSSQLPRKDKLLKLALSKLKQSNLRAQTLSTVLENLEKKQYIERAKLKLLAVEAIEKANRAAAIARRATAHLKQLEQASPVTQTIEAPEPKSYGCGEPVTVSVVDQPRADFPVDTPSLVSNRDSERLTKLRSSNEATARALP